ncbi:hypothetical protein [Candidatus Albibeggiatoa sp. nov. NOAA]|uniref:hypothetical protein n=1 Tax=Candidatus Albibeggiatoa sp. nov. NOAA TaxID=3162724 RepID=UPI0032FD1B0B|nr:hypothetical protein [Thiotrichaceae bacterium]
MYGFIRFGMRNTVVYFTCGHDNFVIDITDVGVEKLAAALETMASVAYPLMDQTFTAEECETLTHLLEKLGAQFN